MRTAQAERILITSDYIDEAEFGIDPEQIAHIMNILRTGLYTRKALAVLREYTSNAWDEHQQAGVARPIKVVIPTHASPYFVCRDWGRGMSRADVLRRFTLYGYSTKRDTNDAVGTLGIGCKSGFCLSDSFTVTSWHGGTKSVYSAALDASNKGKMTLLHEEPCGDETGLEVKVSVPVKTVDEFRREAEALFQFMRPQPEINIPLPPLPPGMVNGFINDEDARYTNARWFGIMGCVPYRIDINQLQDPLKDAGIWDALHTLSGGIYLPIGEVEFAANREELQYTETTTQALVTRFKDLVQEYFDDAIRALEGKDTISGWEKRHKARFLKTRLRFPIPGRFKEYTQDEVALWAPEEGEGPKTFRLWQEKYRHSILVGSRTILLLRDPKDTQALSGWSRGSADYIVVPNEGQTLKAVRAELDRFLALQECDGVPIDTLADVRTWYKGGSWGRPPSNAKYHKRTFRLVRAAPGASPLSDNWEIVEPPEDEHVFFIISSFLVNGAADFYRTVNEDRQLAKAFDIPFPDPIYGYKTTAAKPLTPKDIHNGLLYFEWRKIAFESLVTPQIRADLRDLRWAQLFQNLPFRYRQYTWSKTGRREPTELHLKHHLPRLVERLSERLGPKHPVVRYFAKHLQASARVDRKKVDYLNNIRTLASAVSLPWRNAPLHALNRIRKAYPMLGLVVGSDNDAGLFLEDFDTLVEYIQIVDRLRTAG